MGVVASLHLRRDRLQHFLLVVWGNALPAPSLDIPKHYHRKPIDGFVMATGALPARVRVAWRASGVAAARHVLVFARMLLACLACFGFVSPSSCPAHTRGKRSSLHFGFRF